MKDSFLRILHLLFSSYFGVVPIHVVVSIYTLVRRVLLSACLTDEEAVSMEISG
jgi:hypothetical protein